MSLCEGLDANKVASSTTQRASLPAIWRLQAHKYACLESPAATEENLLQVLLALILHLKQASPDLSIIGQFDQLTLDVEE
jgi:hypothetical protein